jgi:hypothetical protein
MRYFMHDKELSPKLEKRIRDYFNKIDVLTMDLVFQDKKYFARIDVKSFEWLSNFDCFNCLTNCCVQFPYEFNSKARKLILEDITEYNNLTQAISIMRAEGMTQDEIINSIQNDDMLIPDSMLDKVFDRCTCSCVCVDRSLCAIHKMAIDRGMNLGEIIDTKPLWCSIYPLEIVLDNNELYIFVPTKGNNYLSMNDSDFPCMDIEKAKSPYFRRENPIGFKIEEYKPFIENYYGVLSYIFGREFCDSIISHLKLEITNNTEEQYSKKY